MFFKLTTFTLSKIHLFLLSLWMTNAQKNLKFLSALAFFFFGGGGGGGVKKVLCTKTSCLCKSGWCSLDVVP